MPHNQTASTVSLAKALLMALDLQKEHTLVPTRQLELLLNTLIELGQDSPMARAVEARQSAFVQSRIQGLESR